MLYSRLFTFAGFFLIVVWIFGGDKPPLVALIAVLFIFVITLGSNWLLGVVVLSLAISAYTWPQILELQGALMVVGGLALVGLGINTRCPRCGLNVGVTGGKWRHDPNPAHCVVCGRSRKGVWPMQHLLCPEAWDGDYHDQGGGAASDANGVDWLRDLRRKARKRHHRTD